MRQSVINKWPLLVDHAQNIKLSPKFVTRLTASATDCVVSCRVQRIPASVWRAHNYLVYFWCGYCE